MPCAPQSITELDQALGLAAGIFSFFVAEIGYPYMQRRKNNDKKESNLSKKQLEVSDLGICHLLERCHKHHLDLLVQESGYLRLQ